MKYILEMKNINKSFFGVQVLHDVLLQVLPGEVHVLLGENGAGKSTLMKILSAAYKKEDGEILLEGKPYTASTPKEALDLGISVIYQEFNLIPHLSIYENIYVGKEFVRNGIVDRKTAITEAKKYLDLIGLHVDPRTLVSELSVAQKQMVEISKALSNKTKVLVLDEPTAAITTTETKALFEMVRKLKAQGIGVIYISHRLCELFEIGDRVTILRDGRYVDTKYLTETSEQELTKLMVGREVNFCKIANPYIDPDHVVLGVKSVSYAKLVNNVSFQLRKGEIFGISGLVGSGRTELAKCIIGAVRKSTGEVSVGTKILKGNIPDSLKNGVVYLSEDRKDEGLCLMHSIRENIALPNLHLFGRFVLSHRKMAHASNEYMQRLRVKAPNDMMEAKNLSGGNQQKVVIAKWLLSKGKIFIFDEPTRGIDIGARDEIYNIMHDLTRSGASIIMISSDLVEVLKMCDRIAVMREGEMTAIVDNDGTVTEEEIMNYTFLGGRCDG